jgi:esterase/lipase/1-acyl-sn-glycerol-3-phosphate acyltransferase
VLNLATKLIKADLRVHNLEVLRDDMSVLYVVNHFTRLETMLLPYVFNKHTGKEVWSMGAADLFTGRIGKYLRTMGTVSTKDPDRDKVIVNSLLRGIHPWIIFPEGQMIKDKKVIDPAGTFSVYNRGSRRPPHRGAAVLALRAEIYRHHMRCLRDQGREEELSRAQERFDIESTEDVLAKRTVVVPVNITYFPIRGRDNALLKLARSFGKDLSDRAMEELSVEGTILSKDTDIDITVGEPIDVLDYLGQPKYTALLDCAEDLDDMESDAESMFSAAADELMQRYMGEIYRLTRINYDHIFATIIRYQGSKPFTERRYRNRIYLCVHELKKQGKHRLHSLLKDTHQDIIYEDPSPKFHDFMKLCLKEKLIRFDGHQYVRIRNSEKPDVEFHTIRAHKTTTVIANECEPLVGFRELVQKISDSPRKDLSLRIRKIFYERDYDIYEDDYETYRSEDSRHMDVGKPFLMVPDNYKAGIVLMHGYLAAPLEVRALAQHLFDKGYAVYGVRLRGHGTAPEDLAQTHWEEWHESMNRGYVVIKTLTDQIILGGFSTGGCLALYGAGLKQEKLQAVFSINAPMKLQKLAARFAPTAVSMNSLLKKFLLGKTEWDFVGNSPENVHINYRRNPLAGVRELSQLMEAMEEQLENIVVPTLIIQGSKDPIVHPSSGPDIFAKVGTPHKELTIFERERHGIVNRQGADDVFNRVTYFLEWARRVRPDISMDAPDAVADPEPIFLKETPDSA